MKRICKKCGEEKEIEEFRKVKMCYYGRGWCCCVCINENGRNWYKVLPDKKKKELLNTQSKNTAKYRKTHKGKTTTAKRTKFNVDSLSDEYIKRLLANRPELSYSDISPQIIELKRVQIKFHRELIKGKEVLNEIHNNM